MAWAARKVISPQEYQVICLALRGRKRWLDEIMSEARGPQISDRFCREIQEAQRDLAWVTNIVTAE